MIKLPSKYQIGDTLKDRLSDFQGVVVAITFYATGCEHYGLQSSALKDGRPVDYEWFDEVKVTRVQTERMSFERVTRTESLESPAQRGGPEQNAPSS